MAHEVSLNFAIRHFRYLHSFNLWHLQDVSSRDLACMHQLVDFRQLLQVHNLEGRLDHTASEEVNSLITVLSVSDVRGLDAHHFENRLEHWCLDEGTCGQTDDDDGTARSDVFCGLLEGLLVHSDEDDSVWAQTVWCGGADVLGNV